MSSGERRVHERSISGPIPPLSTDAATRWCREARARAAILVEGWSDEAALEALARRRGIDLRGEGVVIVPIGGVTNVERFARALRDEPGGLRLAGLYDIAESGIVQRGLERAGVGTSRTRAETEALGFFACDADLEDELIRALGAAAVEQVIESQGELASFRNFQGQPAQRGRDAFAHLHRFLGTRAGRKVRYGSLLVEALALDRVPPVLDRVLAFARA